MKEMGIKKPAANNSIVQVTVYDRSNIVLLLCYFV